MTDLVPAVGGTRLVPAPDPVARDYITLALRLDQHIPGLVDGYFGPADLKATVDMEQLRSPARLRDDAMALRDRLAAEVDDPDRRAWLDAQLVALETQAGGLAGETLPYLDYVARCFAYAPPRYPDSIFEAAAARIAELLPGDAPLADRLADWDARFVVPVDRLQGVVDWLVARFREQAAADFGLPDGEDLRVSLVTGQPWSAYNWFDGGRRSRVDVNTDLPVRASDLIGMIAHETYPGHHLEHAWKEADLVDAQGRLECSIILINTPECLISEGLADLGVRFASPLEGRADLLIEVFERAGLSFAADPAATREVADDFHRHQPRARAAVGHQRERRDPSPRGWSIARRGRCLLARCRSLPGGSRGEGARDHRGSAVADVLLRLRRGRGAPPALARGRGGTRACRSLRAPAPRAADAGRGHSSRLKTTRSPPSAS